MYFKYLMPRQQVADNGNRTWDRQYCYYYVKNLKMHSTVARWESFHTYTVESPWYNYQNDRLWYEFKIEYRITEPRHDQRQSKFFLTYADVMPVQNRFYFDFRLVFSRNFCVFNRDMAACLHKNFYTCICTLNTHTCIFIYIYIYNQAWENAHARVRC